MDEVREAFEVGIPPEGVDLLVRLGGHGPWIARWNNTLKVFSVAQPSDIDQLPASCEWWRMPYDLPSPIPEREGTRAQEN